VEVEHKHEMDESGEREVRKVRIMKTQVPNMMARNGKSISPSCLLKTGALTQPMGTIIKTNQATAAESQQIE